MTTNTTEPPGTRTMGLVAVALAATGFSTGAIIVKLLALPPATTAFYRLAIGAVALLAAARVARVPFPPRVLPVALAGVAFGGHQLLYIAASQTTSIAIVTLVGALLPLLVSIVSTRLVGERPAPALKWYALLAASGVGIVVWANIDDDSRSLFGDVLSVLNILVFAVFFLFSKRARAEGTHTLSLTAGTMLVAAVVVAPALLLAEPAAPGRGLEWGLLAFLALVPGNGHLLVNWAHRRISAALSSLVLTTVPLLASIWAHLVFGEPFGLRHVIGFALVALSVWLGQRAERESSLASSQSG